MGNLMKKLLLVLLTLMPLCSYTMHPGGARRNLFGTLTPTSEAKLRENPATLAEELRQLTDEERELLETHRNLISQKEEELSTTDNPDERRKIAKAIRRNTKYVQKFECKIERLNEELLKVETPTQIEDH